ncbi:hypothetical protein CERZMDRAFT_100207 [Cercospora zeae-maydis SCOH1-5]|uniref:Uncharacterized protein n=1 Tax=Cercospora zeae-maydis SCOH1-5 TaxID=717836 RepID=A0A6A6F8T5_9PEZI|nr:hypothetical protein CERZMDRAFT_100207 [Cercospora zeae-maydis SCOH1-5]
MTTNAMDALSKDKYNDPNEARTRKLLHSFFGIAPKGTPDSRGYEYSTGEITILQQQAKLVDAHDTITYEQKEGPNKPRIMCDSNFLELQHENDQVKDADGKHNSQGSQDLRR